jgi:hypothetical protein
MTTQPPPSPLAPFIATPAQTAAAEAIIKRQTAALTCWQPAPELRILTAELDAANLVFISTRRDSLAALSAHLHNTDLPVRDRVLAGVQLFSAPFIRLPKRMRTNRMNTLFVLEARQFNRDLIALKLATCESLQAIGRDNALSSEDRRLASAAGTRTPVCRLDPAEYLDFEIPSRLLPPDESTLERSLTRAAAAAAASTPPAKPTSAPRPASSTLSPALAASNAALAAPASTPPAAPTSPLPAPTAPAPGTPHAFPSPATPAPGHPSAQAASPSAPPLSPPQLATPPQVPRTAA